jgi:acetate kinase
MELSAFFKSIEILSDLTDEQIALLSSSSQLVDFPSHAGIIEIGEIGRCLWIVYSGEVEVSIPEADGDSRIIASLERGAIFGEMSILTGDPTVAAVTASTASKLVRIPRETFSRLLAENPKTLGKFTRLITHRLLEIARHERALKSAYRENEDPYDLNFSSVTEAMKILVINCGSSSLKYTLFDTTRPHPLLEGLVEKIGSGEAVHKWTTPAGKQEAPASRISTIAEAFPAMIALLTDPTGGALDHINEINAIGHRVVHGGSRFASSVVTNDDVKTAIRSFFPLAPLHNPYNLEGIEHMQKLLPEVPEVAVFDTAFHVNMPEHAYTYALPHTLCETQQLRRYGFHGTNHKFVALTAATHLKRPVGELKMISCHLGSGASVCAIDHGKSADTSMGMTPLEGLIMGTRPGDVDPGVILHLMRHGGLGVEEIDRILNRESGLKGISGKSNDMREVLAAADAGDMRCRLAVSAFCYRVRKYIGAYMLALGGMDALIFTAGIGENSPEIRARICQGLERFGIDLDDDANRTARADRGDVADVSEAGARVRILVIPADEEKMIARETVHALGRTRTQEDIRTLGVRPIPLSTSAHHVHLSQADFERLFGPGSVMTPKTPLSQPGQFAAEETVNLVGPKGQIENVRILGPARKESQVEISRTGQFKLGIEAPLRDSGDIEGTPGVTITGGAGSVELKRGVICAKRHIHMSPEEALGLGLRDRDVVMVKIKGARELIFGDVLVRVHPDFRMDMHLDTDEANAAQISAGTAGYIESIQHRQYT